MKVLAFLAASVLAVHCRIVVFKANDCNVNFDDSGNFVDPSDPNNGEFSPAQTEMDKVPTSVNFMDKPVDVYAPQGDYTVGAGGLKFSSNMRFTMASDGFVLKLNDNAYGPEVEFVGGQDPNKESCLFGCEDNFFQYLGSDLKEGANKVDLDAAKAADYDDISLNIKPLDSPLCSGDDLVIPEGYHSNLIALGSHAVDSVTQGGQESVSAASLPPYFLFPSSVQESHIFIGDDVVEQCHAAGVAGPPGSWDHCICASECPSNDQAVEEGSNIREAAQNNARANIQLYEVGGSRVEVEYTFKNGVDDASSLTAGCIDTAAFLARFADEIQELSNDHLDIETGQFEVTISDDNSVTLKATLVDDGNIHVQQRLKDSNIQLPVAGDDSILINLCYQGLVEAFSRACDMPIDEVTKRMELAGSRGREVEDLVLYVGNNLPAADVLRLCNEDNKDSVCAQVFDGLFNEANGFAGVSMLTSADATKLKLCKNFECVNPSEIHGGYSPSTANVRPGYATTLIKTVIAYQGRIPMNPKATRQRVNDILALINPLTHHQCYTLEEGYNQTCINEITSTSIEESLSKCAKYQVDDCRNDTLALAQSLILEITNCGILGTIEGPNGIQVCADPSAADSETIEAERKATEQTDSAIAAIKKECASICDELASIRDLQTNLDGKREARTRSSMYTMRNEANSLSGTDRTAKKAEFETELTRIKNDEFPAAKVSLEKCLEDNPKEEIASCAGDTEDNTDLASVANCGDDVLGPTGPCKKECEEYRVVEDNVKVHEGAIRIINFAEDTSANDEGLKVQREAVAELIKETDATIAEKKASITDNEEAIKTKEAEVTTSNDCKLAEKQLQNLKNKEETYTKDLTDLETYKTELEKSLANLGGADGTGTVKPPEESEDDKDESADSSSFPIIPIAVGAAIVVCLLVVIAFLLLSRGKDKNESSDRNVVAFENPMYDDPAQEQKPIEENNQDGDLYDEPAFQEKDNPMYASQENVEDGGGGYLDVQPEGDDDEDEFDEEEDEEEDEEDYDDDEDDEDDE